MSEGLHRARANSRAEARRSILELSRTFTRSPRPESKSPRQDSENVPPATGDSNKENCVGGSKENRNIPESTPFVQKTGGIHTRISVGSGVSTIPENIGNATQITDDSFVINLPKKAKK